MSEIFELAINKAKDGQKENFLETRTKFVEVLGKEDVTLNEGKWQPFFTVIPDLNLDEILIGMTHWKNMQGFSEAESRLMSEKEAKDYFASFDSLAYVLLETINGKKFDMNQIKGKGLTVEFAIRKAKTEDAFGAKREGFFNLLPNYEGYKFAQEFKVHKLDEKGNIVFAENTQAVIIVWENAEKFQVALEPLFATSGYQNFANAIDVETYFATTSAN